MSHGTGTPGSPLVGQYGSLIISINGSYSYLPDATITAPTGSHPTDVFTYTVSDGHGGTASSALTITLDRPPSAQDESASVLEGGTITGTSGTSGTGTLAGDSDPDGDSMTISSGTGADIAGTYGELTLNADGSYSYVANDTTAINSAPTGSHPVDQFSFTVSDGHGFDVASEISFTIDRAPTAQAQFASVLEGNTVTATSGTSGTGVLAGDNDPDGDSLTVAAVDGVAGAVGIRHCRRLRRSDGQCRRQL